MLARLLNEIDMQGVLYVAGLLDVQVGGILAGINLRQGADPGNRILSGSSFIARPDLMSL